jgi:CRISPR-associated endoribonuclease Cas6
MRIFIKILANNSLIPFNYQHLLTGAIHKWWGVNKWHNETSFYSFSSLIGGQKNGDKLLFTGSTGFFFSAHEKRMITDLIKGIQLDPLINFGLTVSEIKICKTPKFRTKEIFFAQSPIFIKRKIENREVHFTYNQPEANQLLTETLISKLKKAGIPHEGVKIEFDKKYNGAKTKLVYYNKIGNKTNICPVIIEGTVEQIEFAWNVGVGNSTGIGFGAIK